MTRRYIRTMHFFVRLFSTMVSGRDQPIQTKGACVLTRVFAHVNAFSAFNDHITDRCISARKTHLQ